MLPSGKTRGLSSRLDVRVRSLCANVVREAVLETEMDQLENELFSNLTVRPNEVKPMATPPSPPPDPLHYTKPPYTPPKPHKITLQTPQPAKKKHMTLCQAICATTLEQFPSMIRNPQLLLSLTVQQTLSVHSLLESGDYRPEEELGEGSDGETGEDVLVSPCSTMICREQIGYDQPCPMGPLENYSDAQVHYDMIPRVEWNVMIPGLQARPCFLKRVKKVPKFVPQYRTRHEELFARRPSSMAAAAARGEGAQEFIVTSSPSSPSSPPVRPRLPSKPKREVTNVKRDLFEKIVTSLMENLPTYTRSSVIKLVRDVREKHGGLSGRSTEDIVKSVLDFQRRRR